MHNLIFPVLMFGSVLVLACTLADTRARRVSLVVSAVSWWAALVLAFLLVGVAAGSVGWTP